ncbi:MAG TPA: type IX secretion system protein PorQ [Bacteroidota bacterium]
MKTRWPVLMLVFFFLDRTPAQDTGTFTFLRNDVSARAAALNGSFVSMTSDPNVIFYNPASLATISAPAVSLGYFKSLLDINAGSLAFAQNVESVGNIGFGVDYINYGTFTRTDESQNDLGTFGAAEIALVGGYAMMLDEQSSIGGNIKFIHSSIAEYSSTALAVDFGYLYQIPSQNITLGGSLMNLGRQLSEFGSTREALPLDLTIGITKRPEHLPVLLNLNFHKLNENRNKFLDRFSSFTFGAEFLMSESVRVRAGYNNEQHRDLKLGTTAGLAGFSFGAGFILHEYLIDYAYNSYGKIGGLNRISLGMSF